MSEQCKTNPCYLMLKFQGQTEVAFYVDKQRSAPYVFRCPHEAGAAALQLLDIARASWAAGQVPEMLMPWDLQIVYIADTSYKEPSEKELQDLTQAQNFLTRFAGGAQ